MASAKRPGFMSTGAGGWIVGQKNAAGADDNSTGRRVSKAKQTGMAWGGGGGGKGPGVCCFPSWSGQAAIGPQAMNQRQRRDEKGEGGQQRPARSERASWAGRRNVS